MQIIKRTNGNDVKIFAKTVDEATIAQVKELAEYEPYSDSKIRIMPDCHCGKGCTIGTTMEIKDKITPNLVGVDIGCGMLTVELNDRELDLKFIDQVINEYVPSGFNVHNSPVASFDLSRLNVPIIKENYILSSIGTLGGGNHFIEIGKNSEGRVFLVIHTGSRNLGVQVAKYYQQIAIDNLEDNSVDRNELIQTLKDQGRHREISQRLSELKKPVVNKALAYVFGKDYDNYMSDMNITQEFASLNRTVIADLIISKAGLSEKRRFETVHNYIEFGRKMLRKGAISAEDGQEILIPINMRDGSIIARGKGNPDWNYSAPHGAGRVLSRGQANKSISLEQFKESMKDIYSTSVCESTIDEAPMAYKPIDEIITAIADTCDIVDIIKPIYNFKAK